jgi:hypothetical protein
MQIGCLGEIPFTVSNDTLQTISNIQWSGSARYAEHLRHGGNALTEFTGVDPDKISFEMQLGTELGIDVMAVLVTLWEYKRRAVVLPLVIGTRGYGKWRWVITNLKIVVKHHDAAGNVTGARVFISLLEYLRR